MNTDWWGIERKHGRFEKLEIVSDGSVDEEWDVQTHKDHFIFFNTFKSTHGLLKEVFKRNLLVLWKLVPLF